MNRPIGGQLDYSRLLPDPDSIRGQARLDARDEVRRAMAAVSVAAHDEPSPLRREAIQTAHAALADAFHMIEATL